MTDPALDADTVRARVRERYAVRSMQGQNQSSPSTEASCCGSNAGSCCATGSQSVALGYSAADLNALPPGADLGLGCGTPGKLAELRSGEFVVDLGSGAGIDCFIAARRVGPSGRVIGIDMTPEMLAKARDLAKASGELPVEFRLGEIEHLPVADASVDVVMSNCVINLVVDKAQVYREAFRVLRPGGRIAIADVVATRPISAAMRTDSDRWCSCSSGAITSEEVSDLLRSAGFTDISIEISSAGNSPESLQGQDEIGVVAAAVRANKPGRD
ncbi:MAG: arsenite methyltransferase [Thermoplasmata archaeon]